MHLGLHSLWSSSVMLIYVRCCEFESGLRWALVRAGEWGDPDTKTLKDVMAIAFEDFRAWRRQRGVSRSQKRFTEAMLYKPKHGYYLQAKAFNGRIVLQFLCEKCRSRVETGNASPAMTLSALALRLEQYRQVPPVRTIRQQPLKLSYKAQDSLCQMVQPHGVSWPVSAAHCAVAAAANFFSSIW